MYFLTLEMFSYLKSDIKSYDIYMLFLRRHAELQQKGTSFKILLLFSEWFKKYQVHIVVV